VAMRLLRQGLLEFADVVHGVLHRMS
jgi:hypothetical protein